VAIVSAALTPFLVLLARSVNAAWAAVGPGGDVAVIELRTREVGTSHTPLVGPYSRFGWSHPGPALFYALAVPYRLLSSHADGLLAGTAIIGAVAIGTIVVAVSRWPIPRVASAFALLIVAALIHALGAAFFWNAWNPYVVVLPFLALVLTSVWVATGEDRALPVAFAFAGFITQTHISLVPEAAALLAVAMAWLLTGARVDEGRRLRRSLLVTAVVLVVMWSPPVVQQLQPGGGNLAAIWRFWTTNHHTVGFSTAARLLASQLSIPAPWIAGYHGTLTPLVPLPAPGFSFPFALVALLFATEVARRRRDRVGLAACSIAVTGVLVAWISIARIVGLAYPYLSVWTSVVGATCWLASGTALIPAIEDRLSQVGVVRLTRAVSIATVVLLGIVTVQACTVDPPDSATSNVVRSIVAEALPSLRSLPGPLLVNTDDLSFYDDDVRGGLIAGVAEHGLDARWPSFFVGIDGPLHVVRPDRAGTVLFLASGGHVTSLEHNPAARQIGRYATRGIVTALFVLNPPP
jgi:hypothetical protein